ncbi:MAG: folate-binding protein [Burkholderiales bacterium]|nr:folate-binding protein [Burkholderiales bacterium]
MTRILVDNPCFSTLPDYGLLNFSGDDAQAFLNAQLTSDVNALTLTRSQYSGYCTPKGRLLASFLVWRSEQGFFLQLPAVLREPLQKRLSMFIMRSKVKARDASGELTFIGVTGHGAEACLKPLLGEVPGAAHEVVHRAGVTLLSLPGARYLLVAPAAQAPELRAALAKHATEATPEYWDGLGIRAGIPVILPATQEEFVPQMVNFDAIGAVSFRKGCYPGQEIVARMHFLGRLKQRMVLAHVGGDSAPQPGDRLYGADLGDQACGTLVNAAASPDGGYDVLAVAQLSSIAAGAIHWKYQQGPVLELMPLPYEV